MKVWKPWPRKVDNCLLCETLGDENNYGGRGLCKPCYKYATERDILDKWKPIKDSGINYANIVQKIASMVGCTEAAAHLEVDRDVFLKWAEEGLPKSRLERAKIKEYHKALCKMVRNPDREPLPCRHSKELSPWAVREDPDVGADSY